MKYCPKCGSSMGTDFKFCPKCGATSNFFGEGDQADTPAEPKAGNTATKKNKGKIAVLISLGVVAVALVCVALILVLNSSDGGGSDPQDQLTESQNNAATPTPMPVATEPPAETNPTPETEETETPVPEGTPSPEQMLQDYVSGMTFLGDDDTEYDICVDRVKKKYGSNSVSVFVKDLEGDLIGYKVDDFDSDGEDELLTVGMDQKEHFVVLSIYEIEDGEVKLCCEEKCLPNYEEVKGGYVFQTVRVGVFTYGQDKDKYICIEVNLDFPGGNSDGFFGGFAYDGYTELCFIRYEYDGDKLQRKGKICDGEDPPEEWFDESAMEFENYGIKVTGKEVQKMFFPGKPVSDYVPDAETVATIVETAVDGMETDSNAMKRAKKGEKIKLGSIVFHNTGEVK